MPFFFKGLPQRGKQTFWAMVMFLKVFVGSLIVFRLLVQREISQMHEHILHILRRRLPIVFCAKSSETFIAKICLYGIKPFDQNIQPEIEFFLIHQKRGLDIPLYQQVRVVVRPQVFRYLLELVYEENALTTLAWVWFANESEFGVLLHVGFKSTCLLRQKETNGRESKLLVEGFSHSVCYTTENFLPRHVFN